jgi:hypothetical protein
MQIEYTLQYRDETEAAQARFPGEPVIAGRPAPTAAGRRGALGWVLFLVLAVALYLLLNHRPAQSRGAALGEVEVESAAQPDPMENNVFAAGALAAGLGAIVYAIPLAYLLGRRRSPLPLHEKPASLRLDEAGLTLRSGDKEFTTLWPGVVALAETKNVFVLKTIGDLRLTIPKRAAGEPERIDFLRSLLRRHVTPLAAVADPTPPPAEGLCS